MLSTIAYGQPVQGWVCGTPLKRCHFLQRLSIYRNLRAESLKPKHAEALVRRWQGEGLSVGTVKNRLSHLRWWAGKIGKPFALPEGNGRLGIENRIYVQEQGKQTALDPDKLAQVKDEHLRLSLELQAQFGLRREEAIKFQPAYAIRPNRIHLKPSWTKGGRPRDIPVRNDAQRELPGRILRLAGNGSLIPHGRSYAQQRNLYERQTRAAGIADGDRKAHGLRLGFATAAVSRTHRLEAAPCRRPKAGGIDT